MPEQNSTGTNSGFVIKYMTSLTMRLLREKTPRVARGAWNLEKLTLSKYKQSLSKLEKNLRIHDVDAHLSATFVFTSFIPFI